jgi:ERF superfamily
MAENEPIKTLLQRLNAIQSEVSYIQKEKKQGMRYSIVSHDTVTASVRPLMVKHGVLYFPVAMNMAQVGNRTQVQMRVRFVSIDDKEDFIDVETAGYGVDDADKGPGKAISYSVKYSLLKCLGLETGDDPDHDQDSTFKEVAYPDPPRRPSGRPETGWREDGARTPNSLRNSKVWDEFYGELLEVKSGPMLTKFALVWSNKSEADHWPQEWREQAKDYINKHREELRLHLVDNDTFPGDRP